MNEPSDDLARHLVSGVCKVSCETKVGELELPIRGDEQVIWLQILQSSWDRVSNTTLYTEYRIGPTQDYQRIDAPGGE